MSLIIRTMEQKVKKELEALEERLRSILHPGARFSVHEEIQKAALSIESHARQLMSETEARESLGAFDATKSSTALPPDVIIKQVTHPFLSNEQSSEQQNSDAPRADDNQTAGQ